MAAVVFGMILVLVLGLGVIIMVAVPARRDGRDVLTPQGEDVVAKVRDRASRGAPAGQGPQSDRSVNT